MNNSNLGISENATALPRQKRRPALACIQCRRRKVNVGAIVANLANHVPAPFEAQETQFSVFQQSPVVLSEHSTTSGSGGDTPESFGWNYDKSSMSSLADSLSLDLEDMIEHGGLLPEPTPPSISGIEVNDEDTITSFVRKIFSKKVGYGPSHWVHSLCIPPEVALVIHAHELEGLGQICDTYEGYRSLSKDIEVKLYQRVDQIHLRDTIPERTVSDRLVQAYLRTFQTIFGILDVPSFRTQYDAFWKTPKSADDDFAVLLLLVMYIGLACSTNEARVSRAVSQHWICAASSWLGHLRERSQAGKYDVGDLMPSAASVLQMAIHLDLPDDYSAIPTPITLGVEQDGRRRLWATVLELNVQESMDFGCAPASGVDGIFKSDVPATYSQARGEVLASTTMNPLDEFTQNSFQFLLMKTIPVRWRIAQYINGSDDERSFDEGMSLSRELLAKLHECYKYIEGYRMSCTPPTSFQTKSFDLLTHRFLFALHQPFAIQAISNPSFFYSRRVCRNTSLLLLSTLADSGDDDFGRICRYGSGSFRDVFRKSALYICSELAHDSRIDLPLSRNPASYLVIKEMRTLKNFSGGLTALRQNGQADFI
ncbi:hypothetical protein GGR54DRAFT_643802 [Hypoxylon sp. NC1633]|nr:hypothetical protein GGR54DRAFT_643802 [Hypoxylon sp. NC1633]